MQFMVIERFDPRKLKELYQRFAEKGRMLPEGVEFINSWIDEPVSTCYQLMEAVSPEKISEWTCLWEDLAVFEVIPVISSAEAREKVLNGPILPGEDTESQAR
jgi:Protein of unknown function (DUF3303)